MKQKSLKHNGGMHMMRPFHQRMVIFASFSLLNLDQVHLQSNSMVLSNNYILSYHVGSGGALYPYFRTRSESIVLEVYNLSLAVNPVNRFDGSPYCSSDFIKPLAPL